MTNIQVVRAFIDGKPAKSLNMTSDGERLFSYNTCIAQHDGDGFILNVTRYSVTTTKQRNYFVREMFGDNWLNVAIDGVRRGTQDLKEVV